jgi:hypothetical protein
LAKDFTKYSVEGIAQGLGKARLIQKIIEDFTEKNNLNFDELQKVWFDDLQGGRGVFRKLSDIDEKDATRYYIDSPISLNDGTQIAVCNQWGKHNVANFILHAGLLGYQIVADSDDVSEDVLSNDHTDAILNTVERTPGWGMPEAISYLIRYMIYVDDEVLAGDVEWLKLAFQEYRNQNIDVEGVWDAVNIQSESYIEQGLQDVLLLSCIQFLNSKLSKEQKDRLVNILMRISVQDKVVKHCEYVKLFLITKTFLPGEEIELKPLFEGAGFLVEDTESSSNDENEEEKLLKISVFGRMSQIFQCKKEEGESIEDIENPYDNILSYFFKIDADNLMIVELDDVKIFEGNVAELALNSEDLNIICDIDEMIQKSVQPKLSAIINQPHFVNIDTDEINISAKNNFIVIDQGGLDFGLDLESAPNFENRYTYEEYGKYHIETSPVKVSNFKMSDLFYQKDTNIEDLLGVGGEPYIFSKIHHYELGELEFFITSNNVKSTDLYSGWAQDA